MMRTQLTLLVLLLCVLALPRGLFAAGTQGATLNMPNNTLGMVRHWTFDGKDVLRTITDSSGTGNNLHLVGTTATSTVVGPMGQALVFDGSTMATSSTAAATAAPLTICAWINPNYPGGPPTLQKSIVTIGDNDNNANVDTFRLIVRGTGNSSTIAAQTAAGGTLVQAAGTVMVNQVWQHACAVYTSTASRDIYQNGVLTGSDTTSSSPSGIVNTVVGASGTSNLPANFTGAIDDVRIYNRALSATEVGRLYNLGTATHQSTTINPPNLNTGMVGHWTFDGKDMLRNVADTSGQGNTGYLSRASTTTVPGIVGQAFSFENVVSGGSNNNYVNAGHNSSLNVTGNYSISFWAEPLTLQGGFQSSAFFGKCQNFQNCGFIAYYGNDNTTKPTCGLNNSISIQSLVTMKLGSWYHIVCAYDGSTLKIYVNTSVQSLNNSTNPATSASNDLFIGNNPDDNGYKGYLDDVRIYNRALSPTEVLQLYNLGTATHQGVTINPPNLNTGMVGHWTFDGKDLIRNVADTSGQGKTARLVSFTSTTTVQGAIGQALFFNGTSNHVITTGNVADLSGAWSYSVWFNMSGTISSERDLVSKEGNTRRINIVNNKFGGYDGGSAVAGATTVVPNRWYHGVVTHTGAAGTFTVYLNGASDGSTVSTGEDVDGASPLSIGSIDSGGTDLFSGAIDDVRVYNRVLTPAEVTQLYKLGH